MLEKKVEEEHKEKIENILKKQVDIYKAIAANADAVLIIDQQILSICKKK